MITSIHNPKIKLVRNLQTKPHTRRKEKLFVCEGVRLIEEAYMNNWPIQQLFYSEEISARGQEIVHKIAQKNENVEMISHELIKSISDTQTSQGIIAVLPIIEIPIPEKISFGFIPAQIRDPGNLGTMLRTAAAAKVDAVFIPPDTTDPYSSKVIRSAMGAHFRIPIYICSLDQMEYYMKQDVNVYIADASRGSPYTAVDFIKPMILVIGGEATGASKEITSLVNDYIHIPMPGGIESLNAATAAAIIMFEVVRQRN